MPPPLHQTCGHLSACCPLAPGCTRGAGRRQAIKTLLTVKSPPAWQARAPMRARPPHVSISLPRTGVPGPAADGSGQQFEPVSPPSARTHRHGLTVERGTGHRARASGFPGSPSRRPGCRHADPSETSVGLRVCSCVCACARAPANVAPCGRGGARVAGRPCVWEDPGWTVGMATLPTAPPPPIRPRMRTWSDVRAVQGPGPPASGTGSEYSEP